jgi:hypothetical protein
MTYKPVSKRVVMLAVEGLAAYAVGQYVFLSLDFPTAWVGAALMAFGVYKVGSI